MKIKSNYLSIIIDLFILVLLTSCNLQKYPKGSTEYEIVKELRNKNIHCKVDSIYIIDSVDTRSYSDTIIKLKSIVDSCERIIADPEIIETILPIATKTSNLLSLYKSESDYSFKRYMIECSQAGNSHRYVAIVRQYPSKKVDIIKYIDFNKEDIGEQAKLYNEIMVFAKEQEAIEKLKNLTMIERSQLLKQKEEVKRQEEIRLQEERRIAEEKSRKEKLSKDYIPQNWDEVASIISKKHKYRVLGIWCGEGFNRDQTLVIYTKKGNYYINRCKKSNDPINVEYEMRLKKKSNSLYEYSIPGDDMPERFKITGDGLDTYILNPDAPDGPEWVFMGSYLNVY